MSLEPLELRIAPATLLNATTVVFQDLDGDDVTVKFSKPILDTLAMANFILKFDTGDTDDVPGNNTAQQLQFVDFTALSADDAAGLGVTISAKRNPVRGGDGFADVGRIDATGIDLGTVTVAGDLGKIEAGNPNAPGSALKSLTVQSLGELGLSTGAPDLFSLLDGRVDKLVVKGHVREARILVQDSVLTDPGTDGEASIGKLEIGGSIIGGALGITGFISANDAIGSVKIGGDLRGGAGISSGVLTAASMGTVSIAGSIVGAGGNSGRLISEEGSIASIFIGGDIRGGTGSNSGQVNVSEGTPTKSFKLGGSLVGGVGVNSGLIQLDSAVGTFSIGGDVRGGAAETGAVRLNGDSIGSITIAGSLRASAAQSGQLTASFVGTIKIGGSIDGSAATGTAGAIVSVGSVKSFQLGGSLIGGSGEDSGSFRTSLDLGTAKIAGSLRGGDGPGSGTLNVSGKLSAVTIGGSLVGGGGDNSGRLRVLKELVKATIAGDLRGGGGQESGQILSSDRASSIIIGGSVYAGAGVRSGSVASGDDIVSLTIKGSLVGLPTQPAVIAAEDVVSTPGRVQPVLGKITIGGRVEYAEILAGYDFVTLTNSDAQIGSITVGGDWIASSISAGVGRGGDGYFGTDDDDLSGASNTPGIPSRIGSVVIQGQALGTPGGLDAFGIVAESIGAVKVGTVSELLVAGAIDTVPLGATLDFIVLEDIATNAVVLPALSGAITVDVQSPTLATWIDVDGDLVTLKTTKPILSADDFTFIAMGAGIQVQKIEWMDDASAANQGVGITITAKPQFLNDDAIPDGDGSVNIGYLSAIGLDLGAVKIAGDLARLEAGDAILTDAATGPIAVQSIGAFGKSTQVAASNLSWQLRGSVPSITVRGDLSFADISISGTSGGDQPDNGALGKLAIGGSLRGGETAVDGGAGFIGASGKIGSIKIGRDVLGGNSDRGGRVSSLGKIGAVSIGGSLTGGAGEHSGQIAAVDGIASVKIGRDLRGGGAEAAGAIDGGLLIGAVTIGGSIVGGAGEESGSLLAESFGGQIKSVKIGGDVRGGIGEESAYIHAGNKLGLVTLGGSLIGGSGAAGEGNRSAVIYAGNAVSVGNKMAGVTIGGDMIGGSGFGSANLGSVFGAIGSVANLDIGKITIKGSVIGGAIQSASITTNNLKSLTVGGSFLGGANSSASLVASGDVAAVKVGGSLVGGPGNGTAYLSSQTLGTLTIGRDLRGGSGDFSGLIFVNFNAAKPIGAKAITIGGSVESGVGTRAGGVNINSPLGSLTIKGSVWGTAADPALILARGTDMKTKPFAIGKLTINGSAEFLDVLGGFLDETQPLNADATIGAITVGGTWRAGDIVAGVQKGPDGEYGTTDDQPGAFGNDFDLVSKISAIVIKGRVLGTVGGTDDFGFSAHEIGSVKIGAVKFVLKPGAGNDNVNLPPAESARLRISSTSDFRMNEVPLVF